jgi:hypothetical protein
VCGFGCLDEIGSTTILGGDFGWDVVVLAQAAVVGGDGLFHVFGEVVPHVPPVGNLNRFWGTSFGAFGVDPGTIPANHGGAGMLP